MILTGAAIIGAGYSAAFLVLGGIAAAGFLGYLFLMPETHASTAQAGLPPGGAVPMQAAAG